MCCGISRRRDHAGDRRLADQVFEEKLRPAGAVEFGGPVGHGVSAHPAEQAALLEGLVDDDRDASAPPRPAAAAPRPRAVASE